MTAKTSAATSYALADIGGRLMALCIDGLVLSMISSAGFLVVHKPGIGAGFLIGLVYHWFFLTRNQGQTPGKALMKIRVIKEDGSPISVGDAFVRYIGYILNNFFFLGWLWALVDADRQGWHDKLARTYVVRVD